MNSRRNFGLVVLIVGIIIALVGAWLYQPALWNMIMDTPNLTYLYNAQWFGVSITGGLIMTLIGAIMVLTNSTN